jgi:hypothetical protein
MFALILALVLQAVVPGRAPPEAHMAPPLAADHIAVMAVNRGHGPPGEDRHMVMRSGSWIREERTSQGRTAFYHSELRAGVSIAYVRDPGGNISYFTVSRHPDDDQYHLMRRAPTGRSARALGERCRLWSTTRLNEQPGEGVKWLSCETRDGIQLWTRAESMRSGSILRSARAISVERRRLRLEEVRPPATLFDLAIWLDGARFPREAATRYAVRFAASRGLPGTRIVRRQGDWTYSERPGADGGRSVTIENGVASYSYTEQADGRPIHLQLQRRPAGEPPAAEGDWRLIEHRAAATVLGESCRWLVPVNVPTDTTHNECRTEGGVPLMLEEGGWGSVTRYTATDVSRAPLAADDFAPPDRSLDSAAWGIALGR